MHIQCPRCNAVNEATVNNREEEMPVMETIIKVVVPVWECNLCGTAWTDYVADSARDAAMRRVLKTI